MRHTLRIVNPNDEYDLFMLHAVFLHRERDWSSGPRASVIQHALDEFREMWNEHSIRGR